MADGDGVGELIEQARAGAKDPLDGSHTCVAVDHFAVAGGDAGGLLASVLEGEQAVVGFLDGFGVAVDSEQPAIFFFIHISH